MPRNYKRTTDRQSWSEESMRKAMEAVRSNKMGWLLASKTFGVPQATLRRHALDSRMALTAAQKQKRYRERMRAMNPEKYEIARNKNAERNKKRKKIADCDEQEKENERKKWRDRKKNQKSGKGNENEANTSKNERNENPNEIDNMIVVQKARLAERRKNQRHWAVERDKFQDKIKQLEKKIKTLRRTANRWQKKCDNLTQTIVEMKRQDAEILQDPSIENETTPKYMTPVKKSESFITKNLPNIPPEHKETVKKQLINHNILLNSLQNTYEKATSNTERNILKSVVDNHIVRKYKSVSMMANYLGLKGKVYRNRDKKAKNNKTLNDVRHFYERDDVSRATAGKKEYRTLKKNKQQIRYLLGTLRDLYKKYKSEGGKLKCSMFKKCRPFYILPPKISNRETCGCIKHENIMMKCNTLKGLEMIQTNNIEDIASEIVCDPNAKDCAYGDCVGCKTKQARLSWEGKDSTDIVSWQEWNLVKHEYKEKIDSEKLKVTKRMVKNRKSGTLKELIDLFNIELQGFKKHLYNIKHQYKQYSTVLKNLTDQEVAIHIDFSENWINKLATEVQAVHFGASQIQTTIHTGVLYSKANNPKTFATISPNNEHGPEAIWAHLAPILEFLKTQHPKVTAIHFFSDGPTSQYRQKKNFFLFSKITKEYGFISSTWNFSESSHGKGAADGVGAAVKRKLDSCVAHGVDIPDALTAFNVLHESDIAVMLYYILQADIEKYKTPANLKPVPGTMQLHQITNTEMENVIQYRSLSCFCSMSIHSGYCKCLDLKSHLLTSTCENDPEKEFKLNDDNKSTNRNLKIEKQQIKVIHRKTEETKINDEEKTTKRARKRKTQQKPRTKTFKKCKTKGTSSDSTGDEEEPVIEYIETDDDYDVCFYSENSSLESLKSEDERQLILDENTGLLLNKIDNNNWQLIAKSKNETKNLAKDENFITNNSNQSRVDILDDLTIAVDSYVLVEFKTNKTSKYYVGKVLELSGINVKINFMRKKYNGTFYWPQIQDVSDMFSFDVIKVLRPPIRCHRGILKFGEYLSGYKIY